MLQHAAAAHAEVGTPRLDAIGSRFEHALQTSFVEVTTALDAPPFDTLARQCVVDEHSLAVDPRNTAAVMRQIDDLGRCVQQCGSCHAARNSAKCGFACCVSTSRTRATSARYSSGSSRPRIMSKRRKIKYVFTTSVSQ